MKNIWKKLLIIFGICLASFTYLTPVMAADNTGRGFGSCDSFLGLTSWDCNVIENPSSEGELKSNTLQIIFNISSDASVIAAYLVIGFVIYGGYLYMFSYGDAGKAANGKKTLVNAFIGLAIVLLANVIFNAIKFALIKGDAGTGSYGLPEVEANNLILNTIQWVTGVAGVVAAIFVVYGGIAYTTSAGDPNKLSKAKSTIINALIGLAIVALAQVIVAFVRNTINNSTAITPTHSNILISKGTHHEKTL